MFTNSKAILLVAISVLCVAVVMPRMFGPPVGGEVRSADKTEVCCGVTLPSDFMPMVVLLCQSFSNTIMHMENMTEISYTSTHPLSFPDCQKLVLDECGLDITKTEELGQLASCVKQGRLPLIMKETYPVILLLDTMNRRRMKTIKMIPYHHQQERPHVNPGANILNPAMTERGRMGAHPGAHSIIGEDQQRLPHLRPGASRMPPLPIRPTMAGPGMQPQQPQGGGTMGVIMPVYTLGIIIFFVYTAMKIMLNNTKTDEDEEEEVENDRTYTDNVKWNDMSLRIERIGEIVEGIAEQDGNIQATEKINEKMTEDNLINTKFIQNIDDKLSKDNLKVTEIIQNLQDEESNIKDNEVRTSGHECGILYPGRIEEVKDTPEDIDPRDFEISLLKARLEETEKAMERIVAHMGMMTSRLAPHVIAQAFEGIDFHKDTPRKYEKNDEQL